MAKARRVDIVPDGKGWAARQNGNKVAKSGTKSVVVKLVTKEAKRGNEPLTVRIYKRDGSVQREQTYPGSEQAKKPKR